MTDIAAVGIAFIGCGYVADMYRACLPAHAGRLRLVGVHDRDPERAPRLLRSTGAIPTSRIARRFLLTPKSR